MQQAVRAYSDDHPISASTISNPTIHIDDLTDLSDKKQCMVKVPHGSGGYVIFRILPVIDVGGTYLYGMAPETTCKNCVGYTFISWKPYSLFICDNIKCHIKKTICKSAEQFKDNCKQFMECCPQAGPAATFEDVD